MMSKINNIIKKVIKNPYEAFSYLNAMGLADNVSDKQFTEMMFRAKMGYPLNLDNPVTFSEKIQWLKLYNRRPEYTVYADKLKVRDYIKKTIGEEYLIPLIGAWDSPDEIDFDALPEQFVLKCNHNSGTGMFICKDKSRMDKESVVNNLKKGLQENYYKKFREWPYKDIPRKVICEKFIVDSKTNELRDYKFFCFNGKPMIVDVISERKVGVEDERIDFYDMDGNHLDMKYEEFRNSDVQPELPVNFELMKQLAEKLAAGKPFVRIDLYEADSKVYFGEITFYPSSGFKPFSPDDWDKKMGSWINLEK